MQLVQSLKLIVHRNQLVADMSAVIDPGQGQQHGLHLGLAVDQHAALGRAGFVGHRRWVNNT